MAGRPKGVNYHTISGSGIADQLVAGYPTNLYEFTVSWTGATAGDLIKIHDNATLADFQSSPGALVHSFRVPTAAGEHSARIPSVGKYALKGLVLNVQASGMNAEICIGEDAP